MKSGQIVCSVAGRDKGMFFVITGFDGEYPLVCNGKQRPLERAKKKNPKHLRATNTVFSEEQFTTNKTLRRELKKFTA